MLQIIRGSLEGEGLSAEVSDIILRAYRGSTLKQYKSSISKWAEFCSQWNYDPLRTTVTIVLDFLLDLHKRYTYSHVNTTRSALSNFVSLSDGAKIGTHPLVVKFMKGIFNVKPPLPRYTSTWDVGCVLKRLREWSPNNTLSLKNMTLKLCMLLALLMAPRTQTLQALKLDDMVWTETGVDFRIRELLKTDRQGKSVGKLICLEAYDVDDNLCIVKLLKCYIDRTIGIRNGCTQLLISFRDPHAEVSKDTLARWIKKVLDLSGVDTSVYKAHSVRAASATAAMKADIPIHDILKHVGWSSEKTFRDFYNKPVVESNNFQEAILAHL